MVKVVTEEITRLRQYLKDDISYQKYLKEDDFEPNDYELYCINHCEDIDILIQECLSYRKEKCGEEEELDDDTKS